MTSGQTDLHLRNRKIFGLTLLLTEVLIIIMYGIFVRPKVHNDQNQLPRFYPMYQDMNIMMLIGFGFIMTFSKYHCYSALVYTFFINAIIVQLYILLAPFWQRVFMGNWEGKIFVEQKTFTPASYCVASVLISFGAVFGRVGPLQLIIMGLVHIIGYTLNQTILYFELGLFDTGGCTNVHTFGAYFGLSASFILSRKVKPKAKPELSYYSNIFAMIGTLFLWMYWPSFNEGYALKTPYQQSLVVINTIFSLTGSCLGIFVIASLLRQKYLMEDFLNATLAGGVIIGGPAGIFTNPTASLCVGMGAGVICFLGSRYLQQKLQSWIGLDDTCGVHNLHGINGILGGIMSAIAIASYASDPVTDLTQSSYLPFYNLPDQSVNKYGRTFYEQGGIQVACIFISMGIGIGFGLIAGFLMSLLYIYEQKQFHKDEINFQEVQSSTGELYINDETNSPQKIRKTQI